MSTRAASPADWKAISALLQAASLPVTDLTPASTTMFSVYERDNQILGAIALEPRDSTNAMVRSLVVAPQLRRAGVGAALLDSIETHARQQGIRGLYLLTDSAESFFAHRGFARTDRAEAPASISSHEQFRSLCPASAAFMHKALKSVRPFNVLFLCTGNSARSILAEAALRRWGDDRFRAFSAGSMPKGEVHPRTLELLRSLSWSTDGLRSKSWDEFARPSAPRLDFVFTVCDNAAGETCPIWPGQPMTAHWGVADPATASGTDRQVRDAFTKAFRELEGRIKIFVNLPIASLDRARLQQRIEDIGRHAPDAT